MPATTTLQVTFVSESAAYENTFGWYNSVTGEGGILFADVDTSGSHPPLTNGATTTFTVNTADLPNIQYFLIPNGANENPPDDLTGAIKVIQLSDGTWAVADVDSNGNVIYVHGHPDLLEGTGADALFTETSKNAGGVDYASSVAGTHQTTATLAGDTADGPTGTIAWEDQVALRHGHNAGVPGDADYNDAVFNITLLNTPPETNNVAASGNEDTTIAVTLTGTDIDGTVTSFRVTSLPANGTLYSDAALTHVIAVNGTVTASGNAATVYFVPNANFNGGNAFQYASIDNSGAQDATPATASITINPVNDAPAGANHTVTALEDGSYTFATSDFGFSDPNDTPANSLQAVKIATLPGAGMLTDNGVAVTAGQFVSAADIAAGLLKFAPAANANGAGYASFTFQVQDNGGTANGGVDLDQSPNTMTVNVTSVNDAPAGADTTVHAQGVYVFSTADFGFSDPNDSPANNFAAVEITTLPTSGTLTDNGNAVHAGDFISVADISNGLLQFTPAAGASASFTFQVQDDGGTANGGVNLDQSPNTFTLIENTPPVANDDSVAATEAGGLNNATPGHDPNGNVVLGTGDAGNVQDTDAQDPSTALTVVAAGTLAEGNPNNGTVNTAFNGAHGSLLIHSDGSYAYTVNQTDTAVQALHTAADTLQDVFHYTIQDSGGLQDSATLAITIHGANDLPQAVDDTGTMTEDDGPTSFNVTGNDTLDPDSTAANTISVGPVTVTGPAGETFANTDAQATIVANQIQVTLNNAHFQQLALGEHATVTVPYTLTGDAGDTSGANLVVTVNGVNDVPVAVDDSGTMTEDQSGTAFTVLTNDTLDADHGAPNNVTAGAVSNLSAPAGENIDTGDIGISVNASNQIVVTLGSDFQHLHDGETATFDVAYTLHGDQAGDASTATLHVTVTGANDAPTVSNVTFTGASSANYNTDLVVNDPTDGAPTTTGPFKGITASLLTLSSASDVDGPNPLSFTPLNNVLTADGGHVTLQADGDFIYTPRVGTTATSDSFSFTVTDGNSGVSGPGTASATATITLQGPHIWYVNADGPDGDGSSEHPFSTLAHFAGAGGVDHAGDIIFLETASNHYTGGITLENNEQLISQSAGLVVPDGAGGAGTVTLQAAGGANVVVDGGVVLGSGNNIQGVNFGTTAGFALSGSSVGTVHVDDVTQGNINNGIGGGVSIGGSSNVLNMDFGSVTTSGGTNGITLAGSSGTFHAHGGTISGASGTDVSLNGGTLAFTMDGTISDATGQLVVIQNMSGGTQSFTGNVTDTGIGTGGGILLSSNTGATISFSGGMTLSTGGNTAFTASSGGTIDVTGTNTVTTTSGTDVKIADTTIGGSGVTFQSVNHNGNNSAIILNNTGSGAFTVTGTGTTAGSGGTIQNIVGSDGVSLNTTGGLITLKNMIIQNISAASDASDPLNTRSGIDGIQGQAISGGLTVDNTTFHNISDSGINGSVGGAGVPSATSWNGLTVTNSTFTDMNRFGVANKGDSINEAGIYMLGIKGNVVVSGNSFSNDSSGLLFTTDTSGTLDMTATGNTFTNMYKDIGTQEMGLYGISVTQTGSLNSIIRIGDKNDANPALGNTFTNGGAVAAVAINTTSTATGSTKVEVNQNTSTVTDHTSAGTAGGSFDYNFPQGGFWFSSQGSGNYEGIIGHNTFDQVMHANGMLGQLGIQTSNGTAEFIIQNNTFNKPWDAPVQIQASADGGSSDTQVLMQNNTYVTGVVGNAGTDVGGPSPFDPNYFQALNGGRLDLTIKNETIPANDPSSGFSHGFYAQTTSAGDILNLFLQNTTSSSGYELKASTGTTFNLFKNGSGSGTVQGVLNDNGNTGTAFLTGAGTVNLTNTAPILPNITVALIAALGGVDGSSPGETQLTQAELDAAVQSGILHWIAAGISADQLNVLQHVTYEVGAVPNGWLGASTLGHVSLSADAAGFGWFVDPTPFDNSEFGNVVSATQAFTDPDQAAAGHMDLLTAVMHEMGVQLGLSDAYDPAASSDLMFVELTAGERRLPSAADVAAATGQEQQQETPAVQAVASGQTVTGTAGADSFAMDVSTVQAQQAQIAHVAGYSAAQGDTFDFSALTQSNLPSGVAAALAAGDFRVAEDAGGTFATLQLHYGAGDNDWASIVHLDGVHVGDPVNVALDAAHVAHLHAAVLA